MRGPRRTPRRLPASTGTICRRRRHKSPDHRLIGSADCNDCARRGIEVPRRPATRSIVDLSTGCLLGVFRLGLSPSGRIVMLSRSRPRFGFARPFALLAALALCAAATADDAPTGATSSGPTPDEALRTLREGNERFAHGQAEHPRQDTARAAETFRDGQHPIATVLS